MYSDFFLNINIIYNVNEDRDRVITLRIALRKGGDNITIQFYF